jgi:hypothetical protein
MLQAAGYVAWTGGSAELLLSELIVGFNAKNKALGQVRFKLCSRQQQPHWRLGQVYWARQPHYALAHAGVACEWLFQQVT